MKKRWIIAVLLVLAAGQHVSALLVLAAGKSESAADRPVKVYLFAGQSNMGGGINFNHTHKDHPAVQWMNSDENDVLYFWNRGRDQKTESWETLTYQSHREGHWEQVTAHRLWSAWQEKDPEQKLAVITVTVGATALNDFWTVGGRAQREGSADWIKAREQGQGGRMLEQTIKTALQQLEEQGLSYDIEAFVWYQGEGDSLHLFQAENYERYLRDLIDGWEDRDPARFRDDKSLYAGSIREWTGDEEFDAVIVRVSEKIQGAQSWGPRDKWEPALNEVRRAQVDYAESRDDAAWVDVDDLPLKDAFHYEGAEYITIGERVAAALTALMEENRD